MQVQGTAVPETESTSRQHRLDGRVAFPFSGMYGASKFAVEALTLHYAALAKAFSERGITDGVQVNYPIMPAPLVVCFAPRSHNPHLVPTERSVRSRRRKPCPAPRSARTAGGRDKRPNL